MEKEKLIKILKKTQSLEQGGNVALAKEFDYIDENIKNIDAKVDTLSNSIDSKLDILSEELKKKLESELVLEIDREELKGERGEKGEQGLKGDKGEKGDTTIVEKVIEKTEVIRETPIVTNEIKEVAVADTPDELVVKLETLKGEDRLDASAIKNLPEFIEQSPVPNGGGWRNLFQLHDVSVPNPTNGQALVYNSATKLWEADSVSGGVAWGDITGTLSDQTDLQTELNNKQDTLVSGTNIKTINGSTLLGSGDLTVSASPGGSDTQIQYNNAGSLGGMKLDYTEPTATELLLKFEDSTTSSGIQGYDTTLRGSNGDGAGRAGFMYFRAGTSVSGAGGDAGVFAGDSTNDIGGTLYLVAGDNASGNAGGNVYIQSGTGDVTNGSILLNGHTLDLPITGPFTYGVQAANGTFAFLSDIPSSVSQATILIRNLGA